MSRTPGRRAADRPPSRLHRVRGRLPGDGVLARAVLLLMIGAGAAALLATGLSVGPAWLDLAGATAVTTGFAWSLAIRTGGRPVMFGLLTLTTALVVVFWGTPALRSGAAVMATVISAVLAVLVTVPAATFVKALREVVIAVLVASVGGAAAVGFRPALNVSRFDYLTLFLSFGLAFVLVYRLGAGFHGLGRRGQGLVVVGTLVVALTLVYGELLRRYGTNTVVEGGTVGYDWLETTLGAAPQPVMALLGIPALVWGCHQRARRRQGWWACAYGVAATSRPAYLLVRQDLGMLEALLSAVYSVAIGMLLGWVVIRADLFVSGSRGRRSIKAEEASAVRPEPARTAPLL